MAQITLNSSGVASNGSLVLQSNGTTTAATFDTSQKLTLPNDAVVNGLTVGKGAGAVSTNTAVGASALAANTTGGNGVAIGYQALQANTTASYNTAVGYQSGYSNTTGAPNTFFGAFSGYSNTTGTYNTHLGREAGYSTTTGANNVSIGNGAFYSNSTGSGNTALGGNALQANTTASYNTAVGYQAGYTNSVGRRNTFIGFGAGYTSNATTTNQGYNTCVGQSAGYSLTTGYANTFIGSQDDSTGYAAGYLVTTGNKNTILGGYNGNQGGLDIRTASNYIVLSDGDGAPVIYANATTSNSGLAVIANASSGQRYCGFQMNLVATKKSELYWDNTNTALYVVNSSGGVYLTNTGTSWTSNSDERLKENLTPIENGLSKVCSLRSVIGNFIADETKKQKPFLIAQDVQAVLPEAVTASTLKDDETNTEYLGVAYTEVIPLLVAAIKELKAEIDELKGQA